VEGPGPSSPGPAPRPERRKAGEGGLRRSAGKELRAGSRLRAQDLRRVRPGVRSRGASSKDPSSFGATPVTGQLEPRTGDGTERRSRDVEVRGPLGSGVRAQHVGVHRSPRPEQAVECGVRRRGRRATPHGIAGRPRFGSSRFASQRTMNGETPRRSLVGGLSDAPGRCGIGVQVISEGSLSSAVPS